jgi:hypothetical protein
MQLGASLLGGGNPRFIYDKFTLLSIPVTHSSRIALEFTAHDEKKSCCS